jgi:serine/threonine protein phosphatase 1
MGKIFNKKNDIIVAIGDIHGSVNALDALLVKIGQDYSFDKVTFVFLGDYYDRGEHSKGVLDRLIKLKKKYHHFVFLKGNHELMILEGKPFAFGTPQSALWEYAGAKMSEAHMEFLDSLKTYHKSKKFVFVHGGIPVNFTNVEDVPSYQLMWEYGVSKNYTGKTVVYGHVAREKVRETDNSIGIDTGCCYEPYGRLTAVILDDNSGKVLQYMQVDNPDIGIMDY